MTCIDDNASSHLGVSDGAASKQKTLTAEAGPGLVRVLPGDEGSQEWLGGLSMLSPVTMMSPRHRITRRGVNTIPLLPLCQKSDINWESHLHVQVQLFIAPGGAGGELSSLKEIVAYPLKGRTLLKKPQNSLWGNLLLAPRDSVVFPLGCVHMLTVP